MSALRLEPGLRIAFRGRRFQVAALQGSYVHLHGLDGQPGAVADVGALVADPGFSPLEQPAESESGPNGQRAMLATAAELEAAETLLEDLREMKTGFRSALLAYGAELLAAEQLAGDVEFGAPAD